MLLVWCSFHLLHTTSILLLAASASSNGTSASTGAVESSLLDANVLSLLEAVQSGRLQPEAAAMQLRERSAGYQQAIPAHQSCHPLAYTATMSRLCIFS